MERILITGGAGFIGSWTVDKLIEKGYKVTILDNLEPQVHKTFPNYLNKEAEFVKGDVTNPEDWKKVLESCDAIIHLAAMVGVGQGQYEPERYMRVNNYGTALMYKILINMKKDNKTLPEKIIVASSKATYGEGAYVCEEHGEVYPKLRSLENLERKDWEQHCPMCDNHIKPVATKESKPQQNPNTYALSKFDQERLAVNYGHVLNIPTVAFRYFNVYGPRQSLNNPYTGVAAIFSSRIKNNNQPIIYEDGNQLRDFVFVEDVADANILALKKLEGMIVLNVGSGNPISISDIANTLIELYNSNVTLKITQEYRLGDTRHDYADISLIKKELGWKPQTDIKTGFKKLVEWGFGENAEDKFDEALEEMKSFRLLVK